MTSWNFRQIRRNKSARLCTILPHFACVTNHPPCGLVKNVTRLVDAETRNLRVEKNDEYPTNKANACVKAKGARGRQRVQLREESGGDDN